MIEDDAVPLRIGFIGLGAIGLPIARRLAEHPALELVIFDVRADVLERERGLGRVASSVADAASGADAVFSVLPADAHVLSVAAHLRGTGVPIFMDFSTVSPRTIEQAADLLREDGVTVLGGSLTRSVAAAERGDLSIFVGGAGGALDRVAPALHQMATDVRAAHTAAEAKSLKIVNNMVVSASNVLVSDLLLLADASGVDPRDFVDTVRNVGGSSWTFENHTVKHLLTEELAPGRFGTSLMHKDANLAIALAESHATTAWFAALVSSSYRGSEALGYTEHYHPSVMRWVERSAGKPQIMPVTSVLRRAASDETRRIAQLLATAFADEQALLTLDALRLIGLEGVALDAAIEHFTSGSASNDFLVSLRDATLDGRSLGSVVDRLTNVLGLAAQLGIPAIGVEFSRQVALSLAGRYGLDATLRMIATGDWNDADHGVAESSYPHEIKATP